MSNMCTERRALQEEHNMQSFRTKNYNRLICCKSYAQSITQATHTFVAILPAFHATHKPNTYTPQHPSPQHCHCPSPSRTAKASASAPRLIRWLFGRRRPPLSMRGRSRVACSKPRSSTFPSSSLAAASCSPWTSRCRSCDNERRATVYDKEE